MNRDRKRIYVIAGVFALLLFIGIVYAATTGTLYFDLGTELDIVIRAQNHHRLRGLTGIGNAAVERNNPTEKGRLQGDGSIKPETRMHVDNVAQTVLYLANLPLEANVPFLTVMSNKMPFIGRG